MKTKVTLLALAWLATGVALAESPAAASRGPHMDRMALLLDLDAYQKTEVEKVLKEQHEQMRAAREAARLAGGERPSREEMQAKRQQAKQELRTKLSGILNETQLQKFEALQERRGGGPGRHHGKDRDAKDEAASETASQ